MKKIWYSCMLLITLNGCLGGQEHLHDKGPQTVKLNSGLEYTIVEKAPEGAKTALAGHRVTVHYTGWLQSNNVKFDSSVDRGQPFEFMLGAGQVIKGWDEGVAGMQVGETRRLVIPAHLAYGSRGAGRAIPPNATLIFDVKLLAA